MKRLLLIMLTLMLSLFLVACDESQVEKVENDDKEDVTTEETTENDETEEDVNKDEDVEEDNNNDSHVGNIGDTLNFDGLHITLNDAYLSEGGEWETPSNEYYLVLDLSIENTTDEAASVSTLLQMSVVDDESFSHDIAIFTETKGSLDGEIGPGRTVRGEVAFDVDSSSYYEFIFEDPFTSGQAIWKFEVN